MVGHAHIVGFAGFLFGLFRVLCFGVFAGFLFGLFRGLDVRVEGFGREEAVDPLTWAEWLLALQRGAVSSSPRAQISSEARKALQRVGCLGHQKLGRSNKPNPQTRGIYLLNSLGGLGPKP